MQNLVILAFYSNSRRTEDAPEDLEDDTLLKGIDVTRETISDATQQIAQTQYTKKSTQKKLLHLLIMIDFNDVNEFDGAERYRWQQNWSIFWGCRR